MIRSVKNVVDEIFGNFNYTNALLDPRWKKRRHEILSRDDYTCTRCDRTNNLHVHHIEYNGMPWEATDEQLTTLCEWCHDEEHAGMPDLRLNRHKGETKWA